MIRVFRVLGEPAPKGSKSRGRYGGVYESNERTMPWVKAVQEEGKRVMGYEGQKHNIVPPFIGPVKVYILFHMPRPKYHFDSKGKLKWDAPHWHTKAPDKDKLERAVFDGLQPFVVKNDALICSGGSNKIYCPEGMEPGALIEIRELA